MYIIEYTCAAPLWAPMCRWGALWAPLGFCGPLLDRLALGASTIGHSPRDVTNDVIVAGSGSGYDHLTSVSIKWGHL